MYDLYSVSTLMKAADKHLLDPKGSQGFDKDTLLKLNDSMLKNCVNEDEYMLTPWRFAKGGWKYVRRGSTNQYLNHPNKLNSIGY